MKFSPLLIGTLVLTSATLAQTPEQQKSARAVFAKFHLLNETKKLNTAAARALVMEEATEYVKSPQLGPITQPDAFVFPDASHAVARVQGLSQKGKPMADVYFYLGRSGSSWKVSALRSLAMTNMIGMAREGLAKKPKLTQADREELANMDLTLSLDAGLRAHFQRNRAVFTRLASINSKPLSTLETSKLKRQLKFDVKPTSTADGFEWVIGGMVDNLVGYGYSKSGKLPPITSNETIWVERLSPNWYLFRTT